MNPASEVLPGVLRTHLTATRQMTNDLATAEFRSGPMIWVALLPGLCIVPMLVIGAVVGLIITVPMLWQYDLAPSGEMIASLAMLVASPVIGALLIIGLPVFGTIARRRGYWGRELPEGAPLYADFGTEWIGCGWDGTYRTVMIGQLRRIRRISRVMVLSGGDAPLLIPEELVPDHIKADLLSGRWRQTMAVPGYPAARQAVYPGPGATSPAAEALHVEGVADDGLADRLARASRGSRAARTAVAVMAVAPLVAVGLVWLSEGALSWFTILPVVSVFGTGAAVLGYYLLYGNAAKLRDMTPPGAPIGADYGADWIGVRLGTYVQTVQRQEIKRVDDVDGVLVVTLRGLRTGILIPGELVPPQQRAELPGLGESGA
ncbi:hypothetical protein nbrc107697_17200 [Gordonia crocea]|uniref:Uncharacterized protein n=2 Tax=Gordonia crocea TaxID=589162 RepID=A0A7I9UXY5_9ACTN|nr:hypothetical protein nbrc107697_17200 [Gordonia crocea]